MKELDKTMYFNSTPNIMGNARRLRKNMTHNEKLLWERLNGKQIYGQRFRRQHPIDIFIADLYCHEVRLVVEIDGEIHDQTEEYYDGRSAEMEKSGIKIIRFKNKDVEEGIEKVVTEIKSAVKKRLESPPRGI